MARGVNLAGPIARSYVCPRDPDHERGQAQCTVDQYLAGAWEYKAKLRSEFKLDDYSEDVYKATLEDKENKFCEGPCTEEEVNKILDTEQ